MSEWGNPARQNRVSAVSPRNFQHGRRWRPFNHQLSAKIFLLADSWLLKVDGCATKQRGVPAEVKHLSKRRKRKQREAFFSTVSSQPSTFGFLKKFIRLIVDSWLLIVGNFALQNSPSSGERKGISPNQFKMFSSLLRGKFNWGCKIMSSGVSPDRSK